MNRRRALMLCAAPIAAGLSALGLGAVGYRASRNPYYDGPPSAHFDGVRFGIEGHSHDKPFTDLLKWRFGGEGRAQWPESFPSPARDVPPARVEGAGLRVSYVGHASFLIQTHGVNLLIDPVWSERASPVRFAGPKRVNAPGIDLADLPALDAVLVSHNHYDHLDLATLKALDASKPARIITPLGNDVIMAGERISAEGYDWGARVEIARGVSVHIEPIYHWSARGLMDRRMALWCAFVIETPSGKIYHVADTGFADGAFFHQMRAKHGGFKLAILPIGAYAPRWFMKNYHIDPQEAVQIMQICGAERALAHHWGTFPLADEPIDEPPQKLAQALAQQNIEASRFAVRRPGEILEV
jgi:L-ascorbate metabolism protein UlaG (beta-lactamase superfamily)